MSRNRLAESILAEIAGARDARRSEALKAVSVVLKTAMRKCGMTHLLLAALSGNSPSTIMRTLKGGNARIATLADIAGAMGCRLKIDFVQLEEANV
jgi:DNA-binding phage protein